MRKYSRLVALMLLILVNIFIWGASSASDVSELEVYFFDVGQGDATLIKSPSGKKMLIDGGPDRSVLAELSKVLAFNDRKIDVVLATHPDADHVSGLVAVLKEFEVGMIVWTGKTADTATFRAWKEAAELEGAEIAVVRAGERLVLGDSGLMLDVLYPFSDVVLSEQSSNETSLVMKMTYGEHRVLLPGDTTSKIEGVLLEAGVSLEADLLKAAHHGSATSTSRSFVKAVHPDTAVISAGKDNRFGHPALSVLANLAEYDILVRRTDKEGRITYYF